MHFYKKIKIENVHIKLFFIRLAHRNLNRRDMSVSFVQGSDENDFKHIFYYSIY